MSLKYSSPSWERCTPPEHMIEEALDQLHVQGRTRARALEELLAVSRQYKENETAQKASISVGATKKAANGLADATEELARQYRRSPSALQAGTATSPLGEYGSTDPATEEFKSRVGEMAGQLDALARELRNRAERWSEQPSQIKTHDNINLSPQRRLLNDAALLFHKYRPEDMHPGQDGPLHTFARIVSELATGKTPSKAALLTPLRDIVDAIRKQQSR